MVETHREAEGLNCLGYIPNWPSTQAVELAELRLTLAEVVTRTGLPVFTGTEDGRGPFNAIVAPLGGTAPIVLIWYNFTESNRCLIMGDKDHSVYPPNGFCLQRRLEEVLSINAGEISWLAG